MHPAHLERSFVILVAQDGTTTSGAEADVETAGPPDVSNREWADVTLRCWRWKGKGQHLRKEVRAGSRTQRRRLLPASSSL